MTTIQVNGHTKPDGTHEIRVPTGLPGSAVEVLLVVRPIGQARGSTNGGWRLGFCERTAGRWHGARLRRGEHGERERLL